MYSHAVLGNQAKEIPQLRGMAATLTMAFFVWSNMYVIHVGDTRCHLVRDNQIKQITTDHTIGNLVKEAEANPQNDTVVDNDDTMPHNPMSYSLCNVIGGHDKFLEPQVEKLVLEVDDRLLLCLDGLRGYINNPDLKTFLLSDDSPQQICENFVARANSMGGKDNIRAIVVMIEPSYDEDEDKNSDSDDFATDFVLSQR